MIGLAERPKAAIDKREVSINCEEESSLLENPEVYSNRGVAYHLAGQIDSAIAEYDKALSMNPDFAYAHSNLGIAYYALGHINRAVQEFIAAINLDPELVEVHYNLGVAYKSKGEFDTAVRELQWVHNADPDDADCHFQLGQVYEARQRFNEAIEHYRKYLNLAPPRDYEQKKQIKKKIRQLARDSFLQRCGLQIYQIAVYQATVPSDHSMCVY